MLKIKEEPLSRGSIFKVNLKLPITSAADDTHCHIFLSFRRIDGLIFM